MPSDARTRARELLEKATPGPWHLNSGPWFGLEFGVLDERMHCIAHLREVEPDADRANGALIAAAPELLTALLSELDSLEELIHTESGFDDHHPNYSPAWAVREMAKTWAAESAALEAAEARIAKLEAALRSVDGIRHQATSHYGHWDKTMRAGAGCEACHAARDLGEVVRAALAESGHRDDCDLVQDPSRGAPCSCKR